MINSLGFCKKHAKALIFLFGVIIGIPIEIYIINNDLWLKTGIVGFLLAYILSIFYSSEKDLAIIFGLIFGLFGFIGGVLLFISIPILLNLIYDAYSKGKFSLSTEKIDRMSLKGNYHGLIKVIFNPDDNLKRSAIYNISFKERDLFGDSWAIKRLCQFIISENDQSNRLDIIRLLGKIEDIKAERCLIEVYNVTKDEKIRNGIEIALEKIGSPKAYLVLGKEDNIPNYFIDLKKKRDENISNFNKISKMALIPLDSDYHFVASGEDLQREEYGRKKFSYISDICHIAKTMANLGYTEEARLTIITAYNLVENINKFDYMVPTKSGKWMTTWANPEEAFQSNKKTCLDEINKYNKYIKSM